MRDSYVFYTDQLNKEYRAVFDMVVMYTGTERIDDLTRDERLGELLDIFLSAQSAGRPVEKIVGGDLERFCREFCSDCGPKNRLLNVFDSLKTLAKLMIFISALDILFLLWDMAEGETVDLWGTVSSLNVSGYFLGILAAALLSMLSNLVVRRVMFRSGRVSMKVLKGVPLAVAVVTFGLVLALTLSERTAFISCPVWVLLLCGAAYLALYYPLNWKRLQRHKSEKIRFRDLVKEEAKKDFPEEMEKKFVNTNKRRVKKGKEALTMAAFLDKEEADCARTEKLRFFYYVLPPAATVLGCWFGAAGEGFESPLDMGLFAVILLAVEYGLLLGMWKIVKDGIENRRDWIKTKRKELESNGENP